jgi:DNA repair ATPase RecN
VLPARILAEPDVDVEAGVEKRPQDVTDFTDLNQLCLHLQRKLDTAERELVALREEVKAHRAALDYQFTHLEQARARIGELERCYAEAIEDIESWGAYASQYFQEKHDLEGCLRQHRTLLAASGKAET